VPRAPLLLVPAVHSRSSSFALLARQEEKVKYKAAAGLSSGHEETRRDRRVYEAAAESPVPRTRCPGPILLLDNRTLNPLELALVGTEC